MRRDRARRGAECSSARWLYVPLAAWLFAAGAVIPYERHFAIWNNVAIGFALLLVPLTTTTLALLRPGRG